MAAQSNGQVLLSDETRHGGIYRTFQIWGFKAGIWVAGLCFLSFCVSDSVCSSRWTLCGHM